MKTPLLLRSPIFYASVFLLLSGALADNLNGQALNVLFPERTTIPDTLFILLPYLGWTQYFSDIANLVSCVVLLFYLFPRRSHQLPFVLSVLGLGYFLRSILIMLNPLGGPLGNMMHYGVTTIHQFGQFPSGHVFLVTAIYLLVDAKESVLAKRVLLVSLIVEVLSLLFSRGHYSLDIVGGLFLGYFAFKVLEPHRKELVV